MKAGAHLGRIRVHAPYGDPAPAGRSAPDRRSVQLGHRARRKADRDHSVISVDELGERISIVRKLLEEAAPRVQALGLAACRITGGVDEDVVLSHQRTETNEIGAVNALV